MSDPGGLDPDARIRGALARTAAELAAAGAHDEAVADYVRPKRILGIQRPATMRPIGRMWRLGVLLLGRDGALRAVGTTTRAVEPGHPGHMAQSVEQRREYRAAAFRGPFARGETVHFDTTPIELDEAALTDAPGALFLRDGQAFVRWNPAFPDAAADFDRYLAERTELLLHPPEGA